MDKNEVSVLFSGGSDCTLAAALLADRFNKIHLLTFRFSGNMEPEKTEVSRMRLQKKFSDVEFVPRIIDTDNLFREIYLGAYWSDFRRYGLFIGNVCAACKLAMFTATLKYNVENDIHYIASGVNERSGIIFIDQDAYSIKQLDSFFEKYGSKYLTPSYKIRRTDWKLFEMGVTPHKDVKLTDQAYENQPGCYFGYMFSIYAHGYFLPFWGKKKYDEVSRRYFDEKLRLCDQYLQKILGNKGK
ncbi:MAG: 7-cyano-7-deazaguanine synthase [Desulfobacteraceae bacterium]|nr:7-cyano-7-deazaguanine synthase [Desulfobacteraceae bacterium]